MTSLINVALSDQVGIEDLCAEIRSELPKRADAILRNARAR